MRIPRATSLVAALLFAGCSTTQQVTSPPSSSAPAPIASPAKQDGTEQRDVTIEGVSILGTWYAVEVLDDAEATRDLGAGTMEMTLLVLPNGRCTLTGEDQRQGSGRVSFAGIIEGNHISFDGMDGHGTLSMSGRRLILQDPLGRSTVYELESGN